MCEISNHQKSVGIRREDSPLRSIIQRGNTFQEEKFSTSPFFQRASAVYDFPLFINTVPMLMKNFLAGGVTANHDDDVSSQFSTNDDSSPLVNPAGTTWMAHMLSLFLDYFQVQISRDDR